MVVDNISQANGHKLPKLEMILTEGLPSNIGNPFLRLGNDKGTEGEITFVPQKNWSLRLSGYLPEDVAGMVKSIERCILDYHSRVSEITQPIQIYVLYDSFQPVAEALAEKYSQDNCF